MDERESADAPTPVAKTAPSSMQNSEKRSNRSFLFIAALVAIVLVTGIFAVVYSASHSNRGYIGNWSSGLQSLTISANGQAQGTDGCNGQGSRWTMAGDRIEFEGFMGTMMACIGPRDKILNGWLGRSASAKLNPLNPNELIFFDRNDAQLGTMVRGNHPDPRPGPTPPVSKPLLPGSDHPQRPGSDNTDPLIDSLPGIQLPEPIVPEPGKWN